MIQRTHLLIFVLTLFWCLEVSQGLFSENVIYGMDLSKSENDEPFKRHRVLQNMFRNINTIPEYAQSEQDTRESGTPQLSENGRTSLLISKLLQDKPATNNDKAKYNMLTFSKEWRYRLPKQHNESDNIANKTASSDDIKKESGLDDTARKRINRGFCHLLCEVCESMASRRWSILCGAQCEYGGLAFDICLNAWRELDKMVQ